jgi:hypothetical protein
LTNDKEFEMKRPTMNSWVFVTSLAIAGLATSGLVQAQAPNRPTEFFDQPQVTPAQPTKNSPYDYSVVTGTISSVRSGPSAASAIRKAAEAVRDAKGDEAKTAAQKNLTELLSKYYDDDMVQREHELKQIEERLTKLRELLDRRRAKKQDIIDLQAKVALNEAEGLGFYDNERPAKGGASSFSVAMPQMEGKPNSPFVKKRLDPGPTPVPVPPAPPKAISQ